MSPCYQYIELAFLVAGKQLCVKPFMTNTQCANELGLHK